MIQVQSNIFGEEIPIEEVDGLKFNRETIKGRFRRLYGYDENKRCGDCRYLCKTSTNSHTFYKCNLIGISASEATDIRLRDPACSRWESSDVK